MSKIYLGCSPSVLDGTEQIYEPKGTISLPVEYSFQNQMPPVLNQGANNTCVTYAVSAHIDWNINMSKQTRCADNGVDRKGIYSARTIPGDNGMTFKEALNYVRYNGVKTNVGVVKLDHYAKVGSIEPLKQAIIVNGPCIGGLKCYNGGTNFWLQNYRDEFLGGHAVAIVGYNADGFILRNSWGSSYGHGGYAVLKYEDFNSSFFEIWTIID